ncbi:PIN domain-containing protein [Geitlerinema sp. P-1104]|nr:PIN domain-containing protein [Geitlerinema sp. P-1104]
MNLIGQIKLINIYTGKLFLIMTEVFLDTSFAIALSSVTDKNHARAVEIANQIESNSTRLVTTQAILLEIGNALSKQRYRAAAIQLLESLETDPSVEVVLLTDSLYRLAFNLFKQRGDKEWGLVDCISFIVMQDRGIIDALTADTHFQQAGFRALLKD